MGCVEGIDPPTAYESERYLCEDSQAWEQAIAECVEAYLRDGSCGGVMSFRGTLEDTPVVVDSQLSASRFLLAQSEGHPLRLLDIDTVGNSPYFRFAFKIRSFGGAADEVTAAETVYTVNTQARTQPEPLSDLHVETSLRLTAGGGSVDLAGLNEKGQVVIEGRGPDLLRGRIQAAFGKASDQIEGCFVVTAQAKSTVAE